VFFEKIEVFELKKQKAKAKIQKKILPKDDDDSILELCLMQSWNSVLSESVLLLLALIGIAGHSCIARCCI
jgi:hypothetical protein